MLFEAHSEMQLSRNINIAVVGSIHTGKSTLIKSFVSSALKDYESIIPLYLPTGRDLPSLKNNDQTDLETLSGITMWSRPTTVEIMHPSKKYVQPITFFDTPGHHDYIPEILPAICACDGISIVVDVVEGLTEQSILLLRIIRRIIFQNTPYNRINYRSKVILVLNKFDRLFLELRLSPEDAFSKIEKIISEANSIWRSATYECHDASFTFERTIPDDQSILSMFPPPPHISENAPPLSTNDTMYFSPFSNVVFSSATLSFSLCLDDFIRKQYPEMWNLRIKQWEKLEEKRKLQEIPRGSEALCPHPPISFLCRYFWGNYYFDKVEGTFKSISAFRGGDTPCALFLSHVLKPIWNVVNSILSSRENAREILLSLGFSQKRTKNIVNTMLLPINSSSSQKAPLFTRKPDGGGKSIKELLKSLKIERILSVILSNWLKYDGFPRSFCKGWTNQPLSMNPIRSYRVKRSKKMDISQYDAHGFEKHFSLFRIRELMCVKSLGDEKKMFSRSHTKAPQMLSSISLFASYSLIGLNMTDFQGPFAKAGQINRYL
ncbi:hypothetical protein ADUPG1_010774 [Aduncisulcus paluster]|uniref:Tr-type G domain-containing protein n=1 Tax=Aduncisulcus paluster TaxID=2918883 RepID=A0ABQ5JWC6_9EUKA|nr:hypothetical protein ADUPG1_010774 [Aduncisulcus paluster]